MDAKTQAYKIGADDLATFLNDIELLPEFLIEPNDRTQEFLETLDRIVELYPRCQHILEGIQDLNQTSLNEDAQARK